MNVSRQQVLDQLRSFVNAAVYDTVFRRALRYSPLKVIAQCGFPANPPAELPVRAHRVSVCIDEDTVFGRTDFSREQVEMSIDIPIEVRLVLYGLKPLALVHGSEASMSALARYLRNFGMVALLSPDQFEPAVDPEKGGYSNLAVERSPARAGSGKWRGLLISADSKRAMLGWFCLLFGWDEFLGGLMGYPACCTGAFVEGWSEAQKRWNGDPAMELLQRHARTDRVATYHWSVNVFARYFGYHIIEHFPCSLNCPGTRDLAERLYAGLLRVEEEYARMLRDRLSCVVASSEAAVVLLPGAQVSGSEVIYDAERMIGTEEGELACTLRGYSRIKLASLPALRFLNFQRDLPRPSKAEEERGKLHALPVLA